MYKIILNPGKIDRRIRIIPEESYTLAKTFRTILEKCCSACLIKRACQKSELYYNCKSRNLTAVNIGEAPVTKAAKFNLFSSRPYYERKKKTALAARD